MRHFKIIGWLWLVFGVLGFLRICWPFSEIGTLIFRLAERGALVFWVMPCIFTLVSAVAGLGLLRHWRWARIAIEILGSILFACSVIVFLFVPFTTIYEMIASAVVAAVALYSLVVALVIRYEPPPNKNR